MCTLKDLPLGDSVSPSPSSRKGCRPPYSSIFTGSPENVLADKSSSSRDLDTNCEQSLSTNLDLGGHLIVVYAGSKVALDTGAAENLGCSKWLAHQNAILGAGARFAPNLILHVHA